MLLLLLGCAVHCDRRESFIENIQRLPVDVQESIVYYIKQVNLVPKFMSFLSFHTFRFVILYALL